MDVILEYFAFFIFLKVVKDIFRLMAHMTKKILSYRFWDNSTIFSQGFLLTEQGKFLYHKQ